MADADPRLTFDRDRAPAELRDLIDRAHAGEEIVVQRDGVPYAKFTPLAAQAPREPGGWPELRDIPLEVWSEPLPEEELAFMDDRSEAERR